MIMLRYRLRHTTSHLYILNITLRLCFKRVVRLLTHTVDNDLNTRPEDYKFQNKTLLMDDANDLHKILNQNLYGMLLTCTHTLVL